MSFLPDPISIFTGKPRRKIGSIDVDVIINESTRDTVVVTKQPVQMGANISDHAYKEPVTFSGTMKFSDNLSVSLADVYKSLIDLQQSFVPFTVTTPKRTYSNMLMTTLSCTTDERTENILSITLTCDEVILVPVTTTTVPRAKQKNAGSTGATQKAGKKSALLSAKQGVTALLSKLP